MVIMEQQQQQQYEQNTTTSTTTATIHIPSCIELNVLCLDHLRQCRDEEITKNSNNSDDVKDYLTIACWALNRALMTSISNNNETTSKDDETNNPISRSKKKQKKSMIAIRLPSIKEMDDEVNEIALTTNTIEPKSTTPQEQQLVTDDDDPYQLYRYYCTDNNYNNMDHSLSLGIITTIGLYTLNASSQLEIEKNYIYNHSFFEPFLIAVKDKGFFESNENEYYDERFAKVVAKFRHKITYQQQQQQQNNNNDENINHHNNNNTSTNRNLINSIIDAYNNYKINKKEFSNKDNSILPPKMTIAGLPIPSLYAQPDKQKQKLIVSIHNQKQQQQQHRRHPSSTRNNSSGGSVLLESVGSTMSNYNNSSYANHPMDIEEAEKYKNYGNTYMQKKEYQLAYEAYTQALKYCPNGPNSHVYFSNRAAALVSMKQFNTAITDSERSLALRPDYGKAHARLGLAHFLLGNYRQAMEAYTVALKYEPDNKSSKNYLEKAAKRLANENLSSNNTVTSTNSYSVVSEWDRNQQHHSHSHHTTTTKHNHSQLLPPSSIQQQNSNCTTNTNNNKNNNNNNNLTEQQRIDIGEKYKMKGNAYMANREYNLALDAYTKAIDMNPDNDLTSYVYYSNRAAALCYLEKYVDAEQDSLMAIKLNPKYGKAYARLGLSRFFLHDYNGAIIAYTNAIEYDPDNATASKTYLAKAQAKLNAMV